MATRDHKTKKQGDGDDDFKQLPRCPKGGNKALSAFEQIENMIRLTPVPVSMSPDTCPLFCDANGRSLDYRDALREVKQIALLLPGGPTRYAAHSLRIGGATTAAACNSADSLAVQVMGIWAGEKHMLTYTRKTKEKTRRIARQMTKVRQLNLQKGKSRKRIHGTLGKCSRADPSSRTALGGRGRRG